MMRSPCPCWGFPACIHLDNAKELHGEMLRRACEQYGITLEYQEYRPVAQPHMGGHVERLLGTLLRALHELPEGPFSNPQQRGSYDSEARAVMTLRELERWLTRVSFMRRLCILARTPPRIILETLRPWIW
jgi:putative transposase